MSFFAATIERLKVVEHHPQADRLDVGQVEGMTYQFVLPRGLYEAGDLVVYIPEDAMVPQALLMSMGLQGKLAGPEMNRVKACKFRGLISQGLVCTLEEAGLTPNVKLGDDVTFALGITKYDPPIVETPSAFLRPLATIHRSKYDIEGAERQAEALEILMDTPVIITEKLEGENFLAHYEDGLQVGSRESIIEEKPGLVDFRCVQGRKVAEALKYLYGQTQSPITLYGELLGPGLSVGNYYHVESKVRFFDLRVGPDFLGAFKLISTLGAYGLPMVPILSAGPTLREWLDGRTLAEASSGRSVLSKDQSAKLTPRQLLTYKREGIVIKPMVEATHPKLGRLILKQRSPEYLAQ